MKKEFCEYCGQELGLDGHCYNFACVNCDPTSQYFESPRPPRLMATIENIDGICYEQELDYNEDEGVLKAIRKAKKLLGKGYLIVDVRIVR